MFCFFVSYYQSISNPILFSSTFKCICLKKAHCFVLSFSSKAVLLFVFCFFMIFSTQTLISSVCYRIATFSYTIPSPYTFLPQHNSGVVRPSASNGPKILHPSMVVGENGVSGLPAQEPVEAGYPWQSGNATHPCKLMLVCLFVCLYWEKERSEWTPCV